MVDKAGILDRFIARLAEDSNVLAVILFGSYARGNSRPESDIDLVVIVKEGYKRAVEVFEDQAFEIVYTTEESAKEYWKSNKHDAAILWSVAKVILDRGGTGQRLEQYGKGILAEVPPELARSDIEHMQFDVTDGLNSVAARSSSDPATASLLLHKKVGSLIELYFDLRREWRPAPKQQMESIRKSDAGLAAKLEAFYASPDLATQIGIAKDISTHIFKK